MKKFMFSLAVVSSLALSACVSQEQADAKMIDGCKAAVAAMIAPNTIKELKSKSALREDMNGDIYRRVKIGYVEAEDFAETEKPGSCLFSEQWGFLKSTHTALLEQVTYNDIMIGKDASGTVQGDMQTFLKLTENATTAMSQ